MNDTRIPTFLYCLMVVLGVLQCAHVYPQLPDIMASHFTGRGTPNGWQPKPTFFLVIGVVMLVTAIPAFIVPRGLPTMPPEKINLPNKDYWLAPERREETWRFFSVQMAWWGCALLFLLLYAMTLAINANLPSVGYFDWQGMWYALGGFLLFTILWLVHLLRHFYKIPASGFSHPHSDEKIATRGLTPSWLGINVETNASEKRHGRFHTASKLLPGQTSP